MSIRTVTVVGVNGTLGRPMVEALAGAGEGKRFRVSALRRASSKSGLPEIPGLGVLEVGEWTVEALTAALRGQDAVVACIPMERAEEHLWLAEAAAAAGVQRYFPADFGRVDARSELALGLVKLYEGKEAVRQRLLELAAATPGFTWTSIVGGHFFDWGLAAGFLRVDAGGRTAEIFDGGRRRSSLSTLPRYGEAVVRVLAAEHAPLGQTANRVLFIQSFCVSQLELLQSVQRVTGTAAADWTVTDCSTEALIAERKPAADAGDAQAVLDLVFVLGLLDGDWTKKSEFAMELLGLEDEDMDAVVASVLQAK